MEHQPLYYLASPYTHPDPEVQIARAEQAAEAAAILKRMGHHIFAPIPHGVMLAKYGLPHGYDEFWKPFSRNVISRLDGVVVLKLKDWQISTGVIDEAQYACGIDGIDIFYTTLDELREGIDPLKDVDSIGQVA